MKFTTVFAVAAMAISPVVAQTSTTAPGNIVSSALSSARSAATSALSSAISSARSSSSSSSSSSSKASSSSSAGAAPTMAADKMGALGLAAAALAMAI